MLVRALFLMTDSCVLVLPVRGEGGAIGSLPFLCGTVSKVRMTSMSLLPLKDCIFKHHHTGRRVSACDLGTQKGSVHSSGKKA